MKFDVTIHGSGYKLSAAVLIYTNPDQRHAFATKHEVSDMDGRPTVRPGMPFTEVDYRSLVQAMAPKEQPKMQWNDQRILARGLGRVLWWSPPKKRSLFFKASSHNAGTFDGRGVCPCPGLVFLNDGRSLYVFAYEGDQTPSATTRLCQAPFFNVWSSGQVCVGNARAPKDEQQGDVDAWERMFFGSHFTHPNFTEADRLTHGVNPTTFWKEMLEQERDHFPSDVLVKLNLCVQDLLECSALSALHERPRARGEF